LNQIAKDLGISELTMYYARHSWATFAAELDIPKETIAAALGHGSKEVTDIYINFNAKKVDKANKKIIEYTEVFGSKKSKKKSKKKQKL
jgi:integrase